jgi:hypothetical protein
MFRNDVFFEMNSIRGGYSKIDMSQTQTTEIQNNNTLDLNSTIAKKNEENKEINNNTSKNEKNDNPHQTVNLTENKVN